MQGEISELSAKVAGGGVDLRFIAAKLVDKGESGTCILAQMMCDYLLNLTLSYDFVESAYGRRLVRVQTISMKKTHAKFLSGRAALERWGVPYLRGFLEPEDHEVQQEYVVFTDQSVHRPQGLALRTCRIKGASKYAKDGICTLPLAFLQVARDFDIHQLIYLAIQMTSYRDRKPPLVTLRALRSCAEELVGHAGRRKALRALKYAQEGARSPMEALLYMFLGLPNCLGGCGFRGMTFNEKIFCPKSNKTYYADLYLPSKKLIIEYNSNQFHNEPPSIVNDSVRTTNLEAEGYKVMIVTAGHLKDIANFETLANNIAKFLKKSIRIRARKFFPGHRAVRDLMMRAGRDPNLRHKKVLIYEVPRFPGVKESYRLYEIAWAIWSSVAWPSLVKARSPG